MRKPLFILIVAMTSMSILLPACSHDQKSVVIPTGPVLIDPDDSPSHKPIPRQPTPSVPLPMPPTSPASNWKLPAANARFDYQLGGIYQPTVGTYIVIRDRTSNPAAGFYNVCYINGFQTQPNETDFWLNGKQHLLQKTNGQLKNDPAWPDEYVLDVQNQASRNQIASIMIDWIQGCAKSGFQAVEFDNLDLFSRPESNVSLDATLAYTQQLTKVAHQAGLAVGQKNAGTHSKQFKAVGFDFAISESCGQYRECQLYTDVYPTLSFDVEYEQQSFAQACRYPNLSVVMRDKLLQPRGSRDYVQKYC